MHRHHKRTPYASNAFPIEPYPWDCHDARVFHYAQPARRPEPARVYREASVSPENPFRPSGWTGSCAFPQITAQGLLDSWQHGVDLYDVYHDLLGLLPARDAKFRSAVRYRVTNNAITSQVAGMVISGMWQTTDPFPLTIQVCRSHRGRGRPPFHARIVGRGRRQSGAAIQLWHGKQTVRCHQVKEQPAVEAASRRVGRVVSHP